MIKRKSKFNKSKGLIAVILIVIIAVGIFGYLFTLDKNINPTPIITDPVIELKYGLDYIRNVSNLADFPLNLNYHDFSRYLFVFGFDYLCYCYYLDLETSFDYEEAEALKCTISCEGESIFKVRALTYQAYYNNGNEFWEWIIENDNSNFDGFIIRIFNKAEFDPWGYYEVHYNLSKSCVYIFNPAFELKPLPLSTTIRLSKWVLPTLMTPSIDFKAADHNYLEYQIVEHAIDYQIDVVFENSLNNEVSNFSFVDQAIEDNYIYLPEYCAIPGRYSITIKALPDDYMEYKESDPSESFVIDYNGNYYS